MNTYEAVIHYAKPCKQGGIQSDTRKFSIHAANEDDAEIAARIAGVNDPAYLYTIMTEINLCQPINSHF